MATISEIIQAATGSFSDEIVETFKAKLISVFREVAAQEIKNVFMDVYDELAATEESEFGPAIRGKDPLSLKKVRPLFEAQLDSELVNLRIEGDQIVIQLMDLSKLSSSESREGPPQTVDYLGFYILGVTGEFAFITPEQYENRGRRSSNPLGRVGGGFLMPRDRYKRELWQEVTGFSFEQVRHPISGQRPFDGFERAPERIDFGKYIKLALEETMKAIKEV
jgi:hypothetical protein